MNALSGRSAARAHLSALVTTACLLALLTICATASAQLAHHPFAVGAGEGAVGHQNAVGAWLLAQESRFYLGLSQAVRATKTSATGAFELIGLSFAYGVFHAAGPGHGKAVITSYLVSNELALRRGLLISLLAALLQGLVATALVGIAAFVFHATAPRMTAAAQTTEVLSYLCIVALGLFLCWRKGWAFLAAVWRAPVVDSMAFIGSPVVSFGGQRHATSRFVADDGFGDHVHGNECGCGHAHMPDPRQFATSRFDLRAAALAVVTAGARPCSGAILVLVFALAQGMFAVGVASTFAMSLGTAITTGALAAAAVYAKGLVLRLSGTAGRAVVAGRLVELLAAVCVLVFGVLLLAAWLGGTSTGA